MPNFNYSKELLKQSFIIIQIFLLISLGVKSQLSIRGFFKPKRLPIQFSNLNGSKISSINFLYKLNTFVPNPLHYKLLFLFSDFVLWMPEMLSNNLLALMTILFLVNLLISLDDFFFGLGEVRTKLTNLILNIPWNSDPGFVSDSNNLFDGKINSFLCLLGKDLIR